MSLSTPPFWKIIIHWRIPIKSYFLVVNHSDNFSLTSKNGIWADISNIVCYILISFSEFQNHLSHYFVSAFIYSFTFLCLGGVKEHNLWSLFLKLEIKGMYGADWAEIRILREAKREIEQSVIYISFAPFQYFQSLHYHHIVTELKFFWHFKPLGTNKLEWIRVYYSYLRWKDCDSKCRIYTLFVHTGTYTRMYSVTVVNIRICGRLLNHLWRKLKEYILYIVASRSRWKGEIGTQFIVCESVKSTFSVSEVSLSEQGWLECHPLFL